MFLASFLKGSVTFTHTHTRAAQDRHLRPGGLMLPSRVRLLAAPAAAGDAWSERVGFWGDRAATFGFDFEAAAALAAAQVGVEGSGVCALSDGLKAASPPP